MNVVIWSKNRACQLDLLLRSIDKYWSEYEVHDFTVIYNDDAEYVKGYDIVSSEHQWVKYHRESGFKNTLNSLIGNSEHTMFLCDDNIFTRSWEWDESIMMNIDIACISLRMGRNISSHYIKGPSPAPEIKNGIWNWHGKNIDWGYPMCPGVGHIFRTADVKPIIEKGNYTSPTELEDAMNAAMIKRPLMWCPEHSIVIDTPINRVQVRRETLCGDIGAKELNDRYLKGDRIDLAQFDNYPNTSAHVILKELKWSS